VSAEPLRQHSAAPNPIPASTTGVHAPITILDPLVDGASPSRHGALRAAQGRPDTLHKSLSGSQRRSQLITCAIGLALTLALGLVLLFGLGYRISQHRLQVPAAGVSAQ